MIAQTQNNKVCAVTLVTSATTYENAINAYCNSISLLETKNAQGNVDNSVYSVIVFQNKRLGQVEL